MSSKKQTQTSRFGTGGKSNHDSSLFYAGRLYDQQPAENTIGPYRENPVPKSATDKIITGSSEAMHQLPDDCIHLMVTSPPYNARKEYDLDLTLKEYLTLLTRVLGETYRVLVPGGRACINVANLGRKPYIPLNAFITQIMIDIGYLMRGEIIWDKGASVGSSTAWGSWLSASNPTLRDVHEYILIFSKGRFKREKQDRENSIERDDFLVNTKSVWQFPTESAKRVGHPAPFPVELPRRLIDLYTFKNEIVLDPFMGSGTTALAAIETGRHYIGYELDQSYIQLAQKRITNHLSHS
ncbi:MAG: site-specific DNA-methyltransferase [Chloroflexi bacterium]|nr:site-specific DNA-methyltransferase [Chloroflexota bacterium]